MIDAINSIPAAKPINTNEKRAVNQGDKQENKFENNGQNKAKSAAEQDAYILDIDGKTEKKVTYSNPGTVKPDTAKIEELKRQAEEALRPLRQLVEELLKKQGMAFNDARLRANEGQMVEIDDETRAEAQRLIAEGGEYSIENTANRLFEFAVAISGGDKSKLDTLKSAIMAGYKAAEQAFGGQLPDICQKTLERTMEKLDEWAASDE